MHPVKIDPPEQPLPLLPLIWTVVDNPIRAWPRALYRERLVRSRVLGRDAIYVMAPELIRQVLLDEADNVEKGELSRRALGPALGDAILTADGARWRWQRRAVAPLFRQESIRTYLPAMLAAAERTRDRWQSYPPGTEVGVAHEMMQTTFDVILNTILFGRGSIDCDAMERSITHYIESTSWIVALALIRAPGWMPYPGRRRTRRARKQLHGMAEAKDRPENRSDLLSLLMNAIDPETGNAMDEVDVRNNLLTFITAGHETTALALTWTFYLLSLHPQIAQQVRSEIVAISGDGPLCADHVEALVYTAQVIQEAMRLYPPAALIVRSARRDMQLGNEEVRAGTTLHVPVYAIHRHEALWHCPDAFDPSRFEPEAVKARDRYIYLPFGAGPRTCIGQGFAQLEATAVLAMLLKHFDLQLRPGYMPIPRLRVTLRPAGGMPMRLRPARRITDTAPYRVA